MKSKTDKIYSCIIIVMIMIQILLGCYMNQIRIIENDEIFSLGLANTTGNTIFIGDDQLKEQENQAGWFSGELFRNYVTVQPEDGLSIKHVFINQGRDNHPPLFYLWVHIVSCFTPNRINYLGAAFINILSMCGVLILMYMTMRKIVGNVWLSIVPSFLWLVSTGCYQLTNYIRMYTLLCFFIMYMIYLHISMLYEDNMSKKRIIQLAVTVCLGGLTHYYFYIFCFFLAAVYLGIRSFEWRKNLQDKMKELVMFCSAYFVGGMTALLIFPKVIHHVLKSDMSEKMKDNAESKAFPIRDTIDVINENVFQGHMVLIGVIVLVMILVLVFLWKTEKDNNKISTDEIKFNCFFQSCILLLLPSILFSLFVTKSALYMAWYYLSPVFMPLVLFTVLCSVLGILLNKKWITTLFCLVLCACSLGLFVGKHIPDIVEERKQNIAYQDMIANLYGMDCIYLSESWNYLYGNHLPEMAYMDEIRCIKPEEFKETNIAELLKQRETTDNEVLIIFRKIDQPEVYIEQCELQINSHLELVYGDDKNSFYVIKK